MVGLLPTALATAVIWFLVVSNAPVAPLTVATITRSGQKLGLSGTAAILIVAGAVAITSQPLQFRLVQLFEGYWPLRGVSWLFRLGVWRQGRRRERLLRSVVIRRADIQSASRSKLRVLTERAQVSEEALRTRFPDEERLLPTSLGNVLRSAEDRLGLRYGIEAVVIWPRLFQLLPDSLADEIDDEVTQMDVSVRLAATWFITAIAATGILFARDSDALRVNWEWSFVPLLLLALSWLSYRAAIESALAHANDIEVSLDLYRGSLIEAMRLPAPGRLSEERAQFATLGELFTSYGDTDIELVYRSSPDKVTPRRRPLLLGILGKVTGRRSPGLSLRA